MSATIIVISYNSRPHFARLKAALEAQSAAHDLIVLDNASASDQRPTAADFPVGARIMQMDSNLGFAAGNNHAARMTQADFIALLNPDAFPDPDWLQQLIDAAKRWPDGAAFGSTQISATDERKFDGAGDCLHAAGIPYRSLYGKSRTADLREGETFSACAAAALYRRAQWEEEGGFDERFFSYGEDVDLGFRLRLRGWRTVQVASAIVRHIGGASLGARSDFAVFHGTRNRLWTFVKDMPGALLWLMVPAHLAATLLFLAISPFRGTGAATWRGVFAGIAGLPKMWRARRETQARRSAPVSAIARMLVWSPWPLITRAPKIIARGTRSTSAD